MSSAVRTTSQPVKGLQAPAEIIVDHWGIPHIYTANEHDAFFMQGYNAARDRLWQIDLWRKRGLGLLAKDFGPDYVEQDRASRMFLYRGDMDKEWASYGPRAKTYTDAFVEGVNAFAQEVRDGTRPVPAEFKIAGTQPDLWKPEDVVRIRSHGLTRNVASEVRRAQVACAAGLDADRLRTKFEPDWKTSVPAGLDPCSIPKDVLKDYELGAKDVTFAAPQKKASLEPGEDFLDKAMADIDRIGSNNWVVAGSRTATGRPILANDPHRAHGVPSLRYIVHLNAPGLSVIGAGEPALPGISIGHNGKIAFGLTIFGIDQEDLYVYDLNPANAGEYRFRDAWEPMRVVRETIEVKGEAPRTVELSFTRHGPVLARDDAGRRAFAMRSVWFDPGTSAYFGSSDYMTAQNWSGFLEAMNRWGAPSENQVYADTDGNIGWVPGGLTPRRTNYDGLMPVPGDGRYEWDGFIPLSDLPMAYNPSQGYFATANQNNLPPGYPINERRIGFDQWADPARFQRIVEVLQAKPKFSLADAMDLQNDDTSMLGRRLVALLKPIRSEDPKQRAALELLQTWDARETPDSGAAALFEIWTAKHLGRATVAATAPEAARALVGNGSISAVVDYLEKPDQALGADINAARDRILLTSLNAAAEEAGKLMGEDMAQWKWGHLHQAEFAHALRPLADKGMQAQMNVGPLVMGGGNNVPHAAGYNTSNFRITSGASFRMVLDVGNWDDSRTINTPGQSGNPYSPHYRDLASFWATGDYVPLLYSRGAVEKAASERMLLSPRT
ncbi:MAG: penicillin acylase family protein [Microvirga sp.]